MVGLERGKIGVGLERGEIKGGPGCLAVLPHILPSPLPLLSLPHPLHHSPPFLQTSILSAMVRGAGCAGHHHQHHPHYCVCHCRRPRVPD